jgi:uncharacterized protein YegL
MNEETIVQRISAPKTWEQLGILVLDGSGSMSGQTSGNITKAQAVDSAVREMFSRFKSSRSAGNFAFAIVTFGDSANGDRMRITQATNLDENASYDPTPGHGGGTYIGSGLSEAKRIAEDFLSGQTQGGLSRDAVILVMTDGMCGDPDRTLEIAKEIKQNSKIRICSTLFSQLDERDVAAPQQLLRKMATDPVAGYKTVYDGQALRDFFTASMSVSATRGAN